MYNEDKIQGEVQIVEYDFARSHQEVHNRLECTQITIETIVQAIGELIGIKQIVSFEMIEKIAFLTFTAFS